ILPLWLAPGQVVVAAGSDAQSEDAQKVVAAFEEAGLRTVLDDRAETLSRRIVYAFASGIPGFVAGGAREEPDRNVAIPRQSGRPAKMGLAEAAAQLRMEERL